jgi:hypothetical protein
VKSITEEVNEVSSFFWLTLNWNVVGFVIFLGGAIVLWVATTRKLFKKHNFYSIWGALAISFVLYYGVLWNMRSWMPTAFLLCWLVGVLGVACCLFRYNWLADAAALAGSALAFVIIAILVIEVVLWQGILYPIIDGDAWYSLFH